MGDSEIRLQRMERILEISCELTSTVSLERLLHRIVGAAAELTDSEAAGILLLDACDGDLHFAAATLFADQLLSIPVPVERSIAGAVFSSGESVIVADARADSRYYSAVGEQIGLEARSLLAVPLQFQDHRIGVLEAENKRAEGGFDQEDVETLTALAAQATVAIENARLMIGLQTTHEKLAGQVGERGDLLEAEREQRRFAEALQQAIAALSSTLDYGEVLDRILEQIGYVVPQAAANIMLVEGDQVRVLRGHGYEQFGATDSLTSISFSVSDVSGLRQMQETGEPLVIPNVERYQDWVYSRPEHAWIKSYAGVPVRIREQVIGFLNVNSAVPGFFSQTDGERLRAFADHAAIAIENARLYDQAQQEIVERMRAEEELQRHRGHLEELVEERTAELTRSNEQLEREVTERMRAEETLQHRNQELGALNAVAQALSASLELEDILDQALSRTISALSFVGGLVALADERTGELEVFSHTGLPRSLIDSLQDQGFGDLPCTSVYRHKELLSIEDLRESVPENMRVCELVEAGMQSYVGAPIVHQDRVLGTFCLVDTVPHSAPAADQALLVAIGRQMGVAVENARLFRDVVRERQVSETLLDTAKALSTTLRLDRLLERVLDELQRVVPYDAVSLNMVRDEVCWPIASRGLGGVSQGRFVLGERSLVQRVVHEQGPVIVPDVGKEPDWSPVDGAEQTRSWLGVPLVAKDEVIGVLMMDSYRPYTYDGEVARRALAFAHQVALAIENSRLYEQMQAKLREANLLHSVTTALSFTLDLNRILPYVARSLCELLNGSSVEIYSLDEETNTAAAIADYTTHGHAGEWQAESDRICVLDDLPVIAEALTQRRTVQARVDDPRADLYLEAMLETRGAQATLILPMVAGDRVLGFAQLWETQAARHFTEGEIATGQTLIHQAAITIYNAQLVGALRQYTFELETQNAELDAFAHTVAHDLKNPLTVLIGLSDLLESRFVGMSEEKLRYNLQIIGQSGRKMRNIIDELLLLASVRKVEEVDTGPLDMVRITDEAQRRLADAIAEQQAEIIAPDIWPVASGYGPWVEEVWVNYLSNALKYGGQPPRVELGAMEQEDGVVRFWVCDNGPGLAFEEQAQLFTPFTRLHQARAKGHGLGLSIVQRIVEKLGGQVGVESALGRGSTFFFTLPSGQPRH